MPTQARQQAITIYAFGDSSSPPVAEVATEQNRVIRVPRVLLLKLVTCYTAVTGGTDCNYTGCLACLEECSESIPRPTR